MTDTVEILQTETILIVDPLAANTIEIVEVGPQGPPGLNGPQWYVGTGVPSGTTGIKNDWYIDRNTSLIYFKASNTSWTPYGELKGSAGPQGAQGPQGIQGLPGANGVDGAPGAVWRTGAGAPSNALGIDGDYYVNSTTGDVFTRVSGTYQQVMNIRGPAGSGTGDMLKSVYDPDGDGKVSFAAAADAVPWAGITGTPIDFQPKLHTHLISDITGLQAALDSKGGQPANTIIFKTSGVYTPSAGTKKINVKIVGSGGAGGGLLSSTSAPAGNYFGSSGSSGNAMIFEMDVPSGATFQINVGAATAVTPAGSVNGANGAATTVTLLPANVLIASAAGGLGGKSVTVITSTYLQTDPSPTTDPNPTYVPANKFLHLRGAAGPSGGGGSNVINVSRAVAAFNAASGLMFYVNTSTTTSGGRNGLSGTSPGDGGECGVYIKKNTSAPAASATGGAGAAGVCIITEFRA